MGIDTAALILAMMVGDCFEQIIIGLLGFV